MPPMLAFVLLTMFAAVAAAAWIGVFCLALTAFMWFREEWKNR